MAQWNQGIKLLLSAYRGPEVILTREKNSLSDFIKAQNVQTHFEFVFTSDGYFDKQAFVDAPGASSKGTNLQHYFNNLIFSPSRAHDELKSDLEKIIVDDKLPLPLRDKFVAWKWFTESLAKLSDKINPSDFEKYENEWKSKSVPFINPFDFVTSDQLPKSVAISSSKSSKKISYEKRHQNIVVFGPPGTGKTRAATVIARAVLTGNDVNITPDVLNMAEPPKLTVTQKLRYFSTQFHPSFGYEDFFEGLRPVKSGNEESSDITYSVVPGIFKVVCQLAAAYLEPGAHGIAIPVQFNQQLSTWKFEDGPAQSLYRLSDRTGYFTLNNKIVHVTSNCSKTVDITGFPTQSGTYNLIWFYDGSEPNIDFVLFIDELNRGNPAKVFGEALSLIEEDKRLGQVEEAEIMLPYSHESFSVPPNLKIICAMNSSDKSLASLDHAFRRRFRFIYLAPTFEIVTTNEFKERSKGMFSDATLESLRSHFQCINIALKTIKVPQENFIGHSYLINNILRTTYTEEKDRKSKGSKDEIEEIVRNKLCKVWENELHSLIREIVGDHKLEDFCQAFSDELSKSKSSQGFLATNSDISRSLRTYLENIQPNVIRFPWKKEKAAA